MLQRLAAIIFLTAGLTSSLAAGPEFWYEDNNMSRAGGYRRIRALLLREGWKAGRKFVQRIRRLKGLGVKGRGPRRRRRGASTAQPTRAVGSCDPKRVLRNTRHGETGDTGAPDRHRVTLEVG